MSKVKRRRQVARRLAEHFARLCRYQPGRWPQRCVSCGRGDLGPFETYQAVVPRGRGVIAPLCRRCYRKRIAASA